MSENVTFRFNVGDFTCLAINDGGRPGQADLLFANAPPVALERALARHNLVADHLPSTWTCLLVDTGSQLVLVDTGANNLRGVGGGRLLPALLAEGYEPGHVDCVILTHGHIDHIGGCLDQDGRPLFPSARYIISEPELAYLTSEEQLSKLPAWMSEPARRVFPSLAGRIEAIPAEAEIVRGVRILPAPGHTVGHIAVEIASAGTTLLNIADAALHPIHLEHPGWIAQLDHLPEQTTTTRETLFRRAAAGASLVLAFHFAPFPSLGHIVPDGDAWRWMSLP